MADRNVSRPTDAELEILRVLWDRGPSTVREVHQVLGPEKRTSYNTTLKLMQIMCEKGTLTRDEKRRPQVFSPAQPAEQMQTRLVSDLMERAFGGSARKLVAALTAADSDDEELAEIRELLDAIEEEEP
jgi:BlaI family penicillinase repressor